MMPLVSKRIWQISPTYMPPFDPFLRCALIFLVPELFLPCNYLIHSFHMLNLAAQSCGVYDILRILWMRENPSHWHMNIFFV